VKKISIIARKTKGVRHHIVRILTPKIYEGGKSFPRPMTEFLKGYFGRKGLVGAEIGVALGHHTENILKVLSIEKLFLIDPYEPYYEEGKLITQFSKKLLLAKENLTRFKDKVEFIRKKSSEALELIPNDLDFIYIDGNHAYEFVKKDIQLYYPKVRKNGVIGGHDFSVNFLGVCKAVLEFVNDNDLELHGRIWDWWVIKKLRE